MAAGAATWSLAFAGLNLWVQYVAIDPSHVMADHLVGLAILNGVAIALKVVGVVVAVAATTSPGPARAGRLTVLLAAAVATLGLWAMAGLVALVANGSATATLPLAGGALMIPGWTYPAFFLLGAVVFAAPARHAARLTPAPRRRVLVGALAGPPVVIALIVGTAMVLSSTGLLP